MQIGKRRHRRKRGAPLIDCRLRARGQHSGMHQDHPDIGKRLDELDGVAGLPGINLQFEVQVVFIQQRKAPTEVR